MGRVYNHQPSGFYKENVKRPLDFGCALLTCFFVTIDAGRGSICEGKAGKADTV